jgi:hypothetical protein
MVAEDTHVGVVKDIVRALTVATAAGDCPRPSFGVKGCEIAPNIWDGALFQWVNE